MRLRLIMWSAVLATALTGCSLVEVQGQAVPPCDWLDRQANSGTQPMLDLVLLVDHTASSRVKGARTVPDWHKRLFGDTAEPGENSVIRFARRTLPTPARIRVAAFDGDGTRVSWQPQEIDLPRMDGAGRHQRRFVTQVEKCIKGVMRGAEQSAPVAKGTDLLGAMTAGGTRTSGAPARRREMVVATDGLATRGCVNLRQTLMRDHSLITRMVDTCRDQKAIPDLQGWHVHLTGLGMPGMGWPVPGTGQLTWLMGLWSALCADATKAPDSCQVDSDSPPRGDVAGAAGADDPEVDFGPDDASADPIKTATFPGDVLFATDSDVLSHQGRSLLERFVADIGRLHPEQIEVRGYTDSRGDERYNVELSQRRAESVRAALSGADLTQIRARGLGEKDPACSESGAEDLAGAQACNRRVEIQYKVRG